MSEKLVGCTNTLSRRGIAIPLVLGVVLCLGMWIAVLAQTSSNSRAQFQRLLKLRRAYFMARSGLQHFLLKVKHADRANPNLLADIFALGQDGRQVFAEAASNAPSLRGKPLAEIFISDVLPPDEVVGSYSAAYRIASFSISSLSRDEMAIEIKAEGRCDNVAESITRV